MPGFRAFGGDPGRFVLVITNQALRDQIVAFSASDVAAIRNGYASEGIHEAREVINQLMAGPASSDFYLLQQDGKVVDGNLPAMPERIGTVELAASPATRNHEVLGVGAVLAPGSMSFPAATPPGCARCRRISCT